MKGVTDMNDMALVYAGILVLVSLSFAYYQKLQIEKSILISVFRAILQLTIVGYLLKYIFQVNNYWLTLVMFFFICFNASWNAKKRSKNLPKAFIISFTAITVGTGITISILLLSGSIQLIPGQVIPITGMIAGNSMVAISLLYNQMHDGFASRRQEVMERIALGATIKQSSVQIVKNAIRSALIPTIDSSKTMGLVSLPGMMSGLIFAGVDPVKAIKFQIMVVFMLLGTSAIATFIAANVGYKQFFDKKFQTLK